MPKHPLLLLVSGGLIAGTTAIPWSFGVPPSPEGRRAQVEEALKLARRDRGEEYNSARIAEEERESLMLLQRQVVEMNPESLFLIGDEFFSHEFSVGRGGVRPDAGMLRVHDGEKGGLDTFSCGGCHGIGGNDGAGSFAQGALLNGDGDNFSSTNQRNPPAVIGLGLVQALGMEMTMALQAQRDGLAPGAEIELIAKGVSFGTMRRNLDGSFDTSKVTGVSADLVVRPFGWKGSTSRLRRQIEEAARIHFGEQSTVLEWTQQKQPDPVRLGTGPWTDPDGDGVGREYEEGTLSATAAYLAMLEVPILVPPSDPGLLRRWGEGNRLFRTVGCDGCHLRSLHLEHRLWDEGADTENTAIHLNLLKDGDSPKGNDEVQLFSDLKRHAMGPELSDPHDDPDGIPRDVFLTRPLWGVAETAPYLHDGRALDLPEAIRAHGGEAATARDNFMSLSPSQQEDLVLFLLSMSRQPRVRVAR